jgi:hypothetical protein
MGGGGGGGGGRAESHDGEKAWSSINPLILSGGIDLHLWTDWRLSEPVFLNVYGAQESIPRN